MQNTVKATELARNTRSILDRVVSRGETVAIERNHVLIAQIVPSEPVMTASQALAGLTLPLFSSTQGKAWLKDSKTGFDESVRNPWE